MGWLGKMQLSVLWCIPTVIISLPFKLILCRGLRFVAAPIKSIGFPLVTCSRNKLT